MPGKSLLVILAAYDDLESPVISTLQFELKTFALVLVSESECLSWLPMKEMLNSVLPLVQMVGIEAHASTGYVPPLCNSIRAYEVMLGRLEASQPIGLKNTDDTAETTLYSGE